VCCCPVIKTSEFAHEQPAAESPDTHTSRIAVDVTTDTSCNARPVFPDRRARIEKTLHESCSAPVSVSRESAAPGRTSTGIPCPRRHRTRQPARIPGIRESTSYRRESLRRLVGRHTPERGVCRRRGGDQRTRQRTRPGHGLPLACSPSIRSSEHAVSATQPLAHAVVERLAGGGPANGVSAPCGARRLRRRRRRGPHGLPALPGVFQRPNRPPACP
jgi:hypothetical protein